MNVNIKLILLFVLMFFNGFVYAADATITLKGNVKASPCVVDNSAITTELGDFYMDSSAVYTDWINLSLVMTCPVGTSTVVATFSGTPGTAADFFYANSGTAKGVNIELGSSTGSALGNGKTMTTSVSATKATFSLRSRIAVVDKSALAVGTVSAVVSVTFTYS